MFLNLSPDETSHRILPTILTNKPALEQSPDHRIVYNFSKNCDKKAHSQGPGSERPINLPLLKDCSQFNSIGQLGQQAANGARLLANSARVHQVASVATELAVASVPAAVSLPLMIGGRSKCVLNLLERDTSAPQVPLTSTDQKEAKMQPSQQIPTGPQHTAIRAEQRRSNMVSVVRPVVNNTVGTNSEFNQKDSYHSMGSKKSSLIDELIEFDKRFGVVPSQRSLVFLETDHFAQKSAGFQFENQASGLTAARNFIRNEQEIKQQVSLYRREEFELNRSVRKQHLFVLTKLEERRRNLLIVQSVWFQRDFKHAIEKMVDLYHQGLMFVPEKIHEDDQNDSNGKIQRRNPPRRSSHHQLNSLNTSLVVDVLSIILLRPKLWTLEICQLLLPIIINDLLMQVDLEYYVEIGLKSMKLILTHFSPVIKASLDTLANSKRAEYSDIGVDLSREDRLNKCLNCYKFILEASSIISSRRRDHKRSHSDNSSHNCKLRALYEDLAVLLSSLESSIDLDPYVMARKLRANNH